MIVYHGTTEEIPYPDVKHSKKYLDFVCACRKGEAVYRDFDIIIGNVANDDVFKTVDMYLRGIWSREKALEELRYYKKNDQICFVSQMALKKIAFIEAYEKRL